MREKGEKEKEKDMGVWEGMEARSKVGREIGRERVVCIQIGVREGKRGRVKVLLVIKRRYLSCYMEYTLISQLFLTQSPFSLFTQSCVGTLSFTSHLLSLPLSEEILKRKRE